MTPKPNKTVGRLWMLTAAVMWSSCGLFVKSPVFDEWSPEVRGPLLAFWRAFFAAAVLMPAVRRPRFNRLLIPMTLCFTAMCITFLSSMALSTVGNAIWLQATAPWWVFLLSIVLLREPVVRRDLIPLCFGALGVGVILCFEMAHQQQGRNLWGVVLGLAAGGSYGSVVLFLRQLRAENAAWLIALNHAVAAVVLLPWVLQLGIWPTPTQLIVLAVFATFQMAVPYLFMIRALRHISGQEAVAIGLLEPVLMPLWPFLLGFEQPAWWTILGGSLILAGLLLRYGILRYFDGSALRSQ